MKIEYDKEADAVYITVNEAEVCSTEALDNDTIFDFDKNGDIIGIELLFVGERSPKLLKELLKNAVIA